jgi:hypothetical protein
MTSKNFDPTDTTHIADLLRPAVTSTSTTTATTTGGAGASIALGKPPVSMFGSFNAEQLTSVYKIGAPSGQLTTVSAIMDYMQKDAGLGKDDPAKVQAIAGEQMLMISKLFELTGLEELLTSLQDTFAYQGFNFKACWVKMLSNCPPAKLSYNLIAVAVITTSRGTNLHSGSSAWDKTSPQGKALAQSVITQLSIARKPTKCDTPTWSRAACYVPHICALCMRKGIGRVVGQVPSTCPDFLCFPGGFVLCMTDEERIGWIAWNLSFAKVIDPKADINFSTAVKLWKFAKAKGSIENLGLDVANVRNYLGSVDSHCNAVKMSDELQNQYMVLAKNTQTAT